MGEMKPLLGVMREVEHPKRCPRCGTKVKLAAFDKLPPVSDDPKQSPPARLYPCGHFSQPWDPDAGR